MHSIPGRSQRQDRHELGASRLRGDLLLQTSAGIYADLLKSDRSDKLVLTGSGSGGLNELKEILDDSKASYAYVRVQYSNDKEVSPSCVFKKIVLI